MEGTCNSGGQSECSEGAPCAAGFICVESVCGGVCEEDPYADLKAECAEKGMEFQAIVDDCDPQPTCNNPEGTPPEVCDSYPGDPGCVCPDTAPVFDPLKGCITKEECPVETSGSESPEESEESGTESSDEPNEEPGDASEESEPDSEESSENEGTGDSVNAASDGCETGGSTARGAGWILLFCWMAVARRQKISQWG